MGNCFFHPFFVGSCFVVPCFYIPGDFSESFLRDDSLPWYSLHRISRNWPDINDLSTSDVDRGIGHDLGLVFFGDRVGWQRRVNPVPGSK